jgi:hypothetical protein
MVSDSPESSAVVQVVQVVQGRCVPGVPGGGTRGLYSSPVPPTTDTLPPTRTRRRTTSTRRKAGKPEPWPPADLALPDTLDAIEQGRGGDQAGPADDSREGRLRRLAGTGPTPTPAGKGTTVSRAGATATRPPGKIYSLFL